MAVQRPVALVVAVAVLALTLGLASAWLLGVNRDRGPLIPAVPVGLPAGSERPEFVLPDLQGRLRPVSEWGGKVLLVNFWATWCPPCLKEIPLFIDLQSRHGDRGLQVVGIAIDNPDAVSALAASRGINYPVLLGDEEAIDASVRYGNTRGVLPYTVVVDRRGRVVLSHLGEMTPEALDALVLPLL